MLVTRVPGDCTDGAAGPLRDPEVQPTDAAVRITFSADPGTGDCPVGQPVPVQVDLGAPLGDRMLMDGICVGPEPGLIPVCDQDGFFRWGAP